MTSHPWRAFAFLCSFALAAAAAAPVAHAQDAQAQGQPKTQPKAQQKPQPKPQPKPQAKAQQEKAAPLPPLSPPLGRIGDVVQAVPKGGKSGREKVVTGNLARCDAPQAFYIERFFTQGALGAMEQVHTWLVQNPDVQRRLFGKKDVFVKTLDGARSGYFHDGSLCPKEKPLAEGWRLNAPRAPSRLCKGERGPISEGGLWLFVRPGTEDALKRTDFRGAVLLSPSEPEADKPCLPRLSATVYDAAGNARLRYHADWSAAAEVEILGDGCQRLHFTFDPAQKHFTPKLDPIPGCKRR